jgi:hypothetical protein
MIWGLFAPQPTTANMEPRIITAAERLARRALPAQPKTPAVLWRKKGCKTCRPIKVATKPLNEPIQPQYGQL